MTVKATFDAYGRPLTSTDQQSGSGANVVYASSSSYDDGLGRELGYRRRLIGCDDPAEVDAAFARDEPHVGRAIIGLALNCRDIKLVAPRALRAVGSDRTDLREQDLTALSHMVRLSNDVDTESIAELRALLHDHKFRDDRGVRIRRLDFRPAPKASPLATSLGIQMLT